MSAPAVSEGVNRPPGAPLATPNDGGERPERTAGRAARAARADAGTGAGRHPARCRAASGKTIEMSPMARKTSGGATRRRQSDGRTPIGPGDRADEADRPRPISGEATSAQRYTSGVIGVGRNGVDRARWAREARGLVAIVRGGERRQDQPQRQRPAQHFERENCAAERHAVDGGHARAGADRDHEPALLVRKLSRLGGQIAEHRARLLRPAFAAERSAHADDDDRQYRAAQRSEASAIGPHETRSPWYSMLLPLASRVKSHWPAPVTRPAPSSRAMWRKGKPAAPHRPVRSGRWSPQARLLHLLEQRGEKRRANAGGEPGHDDGEPEAHRARVAERPGNVGAGRRAGARCGGLRSCFQCSSPHARPDPALHANA